MKKKSNRNLRIKPNSLRYQIPANVILLSGNGTKLHLYHVQPYEEREEGVTMDV